MQLNLPQKDNDAAIPFCAPELRRYLPLDSGCTNEGRGNSELGMRGDVARPDC